MQILEESQKSRTVINREKRIEKYKVEIKEIQDKLKEEELKLEEELNGIIKRQAEDMVITFKELGLDMTLDEFIKKLKNKEIHITKSEIY